MVVPTQNDGTLFFELTHNVHHLEQDLELDDLGTSADLDLVRLLVVV